MCLHFRIGYIELVFFTRSSGSEPDLGIMIKPFLFGIGSILAVPIASVNVYPFTVFVVKPIGGIKMTRFQKILLVNGMTVDLFCILCVFYLPDLIIVVLKITGFKTGLGLQVAHYPKCCSLVAVEMFHEKIP